MAGALLLLTLWMASDKAEFCRDMTGVESMELAAGGFECELRTDGELTCDDGQGAEFRSTVELETDDCVDRAYLVSVDDDLLLFYERSGGGYGASAALRLAPTGVVSWRQQVSGFNLSEPLVAATSVYLATIDFVGRLDAAEGEWVWRQESLQERIGALISPGALRREGDRLVVTSSGPHQEDCELVFAAADGDLLSAECR